MFNMCDILLSDTFQDPFIFLHITNGAFEFG